MNMEFLHRQTHTVEPTGEPPVGCVCVCVCKKRARVTLKISDREAATLRYVVLHLDCIQFNYTHVYLCNYTLKCQVLNRDSLK